jgi:hypothetical protein
MKTIRLTALVFALSWITAATAHAWTTEEVDWPDAWGGRGGRSSIAIDSAGAVHIASRNVTLDALQYSTNASGSWVTTLVDWVGNAGGDISIAVDSEGKVHISYGYAPHFTDNYELKYATNASGDWVTSVLDPDGGPGTSIAVDSEDKVHICHTSDDPYELRYTTNASGAWVTTALDPDGGHGTSIAVDSENKVHISYDGTSGLTYTTNASGAWVTTALDPDGDYDTSIAVDNEDKVHICYASDYPYELRHTTNASGSWVTTVLDSEAGGSSIAPSIAVDSENKVHICHVRNVGGSYPDPQLMYTSNASGAWVTETVDPDGRTPSIAVDSEDKVHISYVGGSYPGNRVNYTTNASGSWVTETVDSPGSVGLYNSIALDSADKVHISYYDSSKDELKYATNASGDWVTTTVDSGGLGTSIAVDGSDRVHIAYASSDLKYATNASGDWVMTTVDTYPCGPPSIALDGSGRVHIAYISSDLKYATNASGDWVMTTVDNMGADDTYGPPSIAVDRSGKVHIGYITVWWAFIVDLKYATNTSGEWVSTNINTSDVAGLYPAIAVDSSNKVHMTFYGSRADGWTGLMYATNAPGYWGRIGVDTLLINYLPLVPVNTSITVDSADKIHVSYYDNTYQDLKYAIKASGGWVIMRACNRADGCGLCSSVAVDSEGSVRISHYGEDGTLLLTSSSPCVDNDGDGYGDPQGPECTYPIRDCDDGDPAVNPGALEVAGNAKDDDCDGKVDEPCFIATAALGTQMEGKIEVLRSFRDRRLADSTLGRVLINTYYEYSPPIAEYIGEREWLRSLVRILLFPVIGIVSLQT